MATDGQACGGGSMHCTVRAVDAIVHAAGTRVEGVAVGGDDERELIEFETPVTLAVAFPERINAPEDLRRCSQCGSRSQPLPASELTVIKHRVSNQPLGQLRLYCPEHLVDAKDEWESASAGGGHKMGPICPNCFLAVPYGTRRCDSCGEVVT